MSSTDPTGEQAPRAHARLPAVPDLVARQLREEGRARRVGAPRGGHGTWTPGPERTDPLALLRADDHDRIADLVPVRYARMAVSPFAFLRGAAAVMAADLATCPDSGIVVQLCGDAHVANFGVFATAERRLVFDVNDFDETLPGPFEWDVKRLVASAIVAARANGHTEEQARRAGLAAVGSYCRRINEMAGWSTLAIWYASVDVDEMLLHPRDYGAGRGVAEELRASATRTSLEAFDKLTAVVDSRRVIADDPPLVTHDPDSAELEHVRAFHRTYLESIPWERRRLFDRFRLVDAARKVVGVGSVGTRCSIVLMEGIADNEPLFLQVKAARASVLEPYLGRSEHANHAERVVTGQRLLQAASDPLLGWARLPDADLYVRQLWDRKGAPELTGAGPKLLTNYARVCGASLARAHARSTHPATIAGYVGTGSAFPNAVLAFAVAYADQTSRDHTALVEAITAGAVPATPKA